LKINFYSIVIFSFLILFSFSCQETEEDSSLNDSIDTSTLDEELFGESSSLDEIFFNFNNELIILMIIILWLV